MGELRQRGKGKIWWIRYYRNGKRYEESSRSAVKKAAVDLLKLREGDGVRGMPVTPKIGRFRFDEAAADVVNDYRTNGKRSLAHVERRIKLHLTPYFGGRRMTEITTVEIRGFITRRQAAAASNAEINRELSIVKRAFRLSLQAGKLLTMPHVPMLQEHNVRTGFFERDEFEAVRAALPTSLQPVAAFAYLTGWRVPSEVLPLEWRQVDRGAGVVRINPGQTKNAEGRTFPYGDLLPELRDVLEAQWDAHETLKAAGVVCPYVFQRDGAPIRDFRGAWQAACATAGCPDRIPHDFRRTAVRNLSRAGVPDTIAMKLTGHKTRSVFDRYDIVNEADLRDAIGKLAAAGTEKGQSTRSGQVRAFARSV